VAQVFGEAAQLKAVVHRASGNAGGTSTERLTTGFSGATITIGAAGGSGAGAGLVVIEEYG